VLFFRIATPTLRDSCSDIDCLNKQCKCCKENNDEMVGYWRRHGRLDCELRCSWLAHQRRRLPGLTPQTP
ncbi:MAG: hypothetical protein ACTHNO_18160, partial [Ralstonia sp.]|uniref:hypothetical protein n=1 Tax=Ralstonia sp. TaxID=54061 RepID=UPI003F7CFEA2